jgi:hypothetical protein
LATPHSPWNPSYEGDNGISVEELRVRVRRNEYNIPEIAKVTLLEADD